MAKTIPIELYYEETGRGTPVVLLHGFPFNHHLWDAQRAALGGNYRVITPDLRGHGESPAPDGPYSMDELADDVFALLDRLGIERAVWGGHSMGGYVLMAALRRAPERINAAVFVATHAQADTPERQITRRESAELALKNGSGDVAFGMMPVLFSTAVEGKSTMAQSIYDIMVKTPPAGVAGSLYGMAARPSSADSLRNLGIPALVVGGTEDQLVKPELIEELSSLIPQATLIWIDGVGHLPMIEKPDETTTALRSFLRSVAG